MIGIFSTSSSDAGVKEYQVFLIRHGLMTWMVNDDCKPVLISKISN